MHDLYNVFEKEDEKEVQNDKKFQNLIMKSVLKSSATVPFNEHNVHVQYKHKVMC